jgi:hypothetical protein
MAAAAAWSQVPAYPNVKFYDTTPFAANPNVTGRQGWRPASQQRAS